MTSHGQQQWYDMEQFDLEEALRLFCETTTRSFLWGMWNEHQRAKILEERVAKQRQIINDRDDRITELEEALEFEQGLACEQAETIRELDDLLRRNAVDYAQQLSQVRTDYEDRGKLIEMLHDNTACRDEDVRKLKIRIVQLEEDKERLLQRNERLNTIVEAKRGVGQ